jgi:hypothetical protein
MKCSRAFLPTAGDKPSKRVKSSEVVQNLILHTLVLTSLHQDGWTYDVYVFPIKATFGSAKEIALEVIRETGVDRIDNDVFLSARHPARYVNSKTILSLRFKNLSVATALINCIHSNPPQGLEHIQAMTASAYAKYRADGDSGEDKGKGKGKGKAKCHDLAPFQHFRSMIDPGHPRLSTCSSSLNQGHPGLSKQ